MFPKMDQKNWSLTSRIVYKTSVQQYGLHVDTDSRTVISILRDPQNLRNNIFYCIFLVFFSYK